MLFKSKTSRPWLATSGAVAALALALAGCGGGEQEFRDSQELWESLDGLVSCTGDDLYLESKDASGEVPAFSEVGCAFADIGNGTAVTFDALVVEDAETLQLFIENDNMSPTLKGSNWAISVNPESDSEQMVVDNWIEEVQSRIGGELG